MSQSVPVLNLWLQSNSMIRQCVLHLQTTNVYFTLRIPHFKSHIILPTGLILLPFAGDSIMPLQGCNNNIFFFKTSSTYA